MTGCEWRLAQPYPLAAPGWLWSRSWPQWMNILDLTLPTPAENLACDEALLDAAEAGEAGEVLRFWEPPQYFVVVGYANKVATEVSVTACESRGVPILRRCSGGGTVLQGPGCLNYALILRIQASELLHSIPAANGFILERHRAAIEALLIREPPSKPDPAAGRSAAPSSPDGEKGISEKSKTRIQIQGHTDLTLDGLKFSGNSQRRRRRFLLFHGTFLLNLDMALVEALLPPPSKQPDYRQHRSHTDFLTNLHQPATTVQTALMQAWEATVPRADIPRAQIETLVRGKYATRAWSFKF